jgi:hypothetical protein
MRRPNLKNYVNLLNEIHYSGYVNNAMLRKNQVSNHTIISLRGMKLIDDNNKSIMKGKPSAILAEEIVKHNRTRRVNSKGKIKHTKEVAKSKFEISILWGFFKITL